ncbi:tetratricopeptide repeat protein [Niallia sp. Krafla_26]|uniref:tetratricopeptide repeat protein n=1 Tax=Niallia sp. Krafla_26 TaxID=3064703 RepID=UPI003D17A8FC
MSKNAHAKTKGQLLTFIPTGEYYFTLGLKAFQRREFQKAIKYLKRAMHLEPGEPMIVCQLAIIYTEIGEFQQSNDLLHSVLEELDEEMIECHYFLANNYAHMGYFKDAYTHLTIYLENDPNGDFIHEAEDLLEILTLEEDVLDEDSYEHDDLIMKQEQAKELLESGDFSKAIKLLKSVIKDFPEYWSAYNNLALAYFYLGEIEKAAGVLDQVMEKNPGNLHAVCNKLVFAFFQQDFQEVKEISSLLKKVKPMSSEHQFKLGATFALIGEYEAAYGWFHKLYKQGFNGDGPFYYWFSYASYFTGREQLAHSLWDKVLQINPQKKDLAPWNNENAHINGLEKYDTWILKYLESDLIEERLFAVFLLSKSDHKESILTKTEVRENKKFSKLENQYVSFVKDKQADDGQMVVAHETAQLLYQYHHPVGTVEASLYLLWFSVFTELNKAKVSLKNEKALAAAMDYIWKKLRREKCSQQQIAHQYGLSSSTLQKYVKLINEYL